jgi:molybdopterin molybdotransferase
MASLQPHGTSVEPGPHQAGHQRHHAQHQARSVADHAAAVANLLRPLQSPERTERLPLREALGKGLVDSVTAPISLPPFANSQMDGYAIRSVDVPCLPFQRGQAPLHFNPARLHRS